MVSNSRQRNQLEFLMSNTHDAIYRRLRFHQDYLLIFIFQRCEHNETRRTPEEECLSDRERMRAVAFKPVIGIVRQWQPTATTPLSLQPNICATCFRKLHSPFISPPLSFYRTWSQHLLDRNCLRSFVYQQQQQQQFIHHVTFQFDPNPRRVFENASIFQIEKERKKKLDSPILDELLEQRSKCVDRKKSTQVSSSSRLSGVAKTVNRSRYLPLPSRFERWQLQRAIQERMEKSASGTYARHNRPSCCERGPAECWSILFPRTS